MGRPGGKLPDFRWLIISFHDFPAQPSLGLPFNLLKACRNGGASRWNPSGLGRVSFRGRSVWSGRLGRIGGYGYSRRSGLL